MATDVDVGFGHVLVGALAGVQGFDGSHEGVAVESHAIREDVEVWCYDGVQLRDILCACCTEYCAHRIDDLLLVGGEALLLGSCGRDVWRNAQGERNGQRDRRLQ